MKTNLRGKLTAAVVGGAMLAAGGIAAAQPANASAYNCYAGFVNANTAWGQCHNASGGWGGFKLTVNCYYAPQRTSYGQAPRTIWASCPSWSHVTGIYITPTAY